jgi:hypothetical protein
VSISTDTLASGPGRPDAAADFEAVDVGQHQVEDHQVGRVLLQLLQAARAVGRRG